MMAKTTWIMQNGGWNFAKRYYSLVAYSFIMILGLAKVIQENTLAALLEL